MNNGLGQKNKQGQANSRRVGVIEIGSRAVRLLVAEVSVGGVVEAVLSRVQETRLMDAVQEGASAEREELERIAGAVQRFRAQALAFNANPVAVFGTELLRRVAGSEQYLASSLRSAVNAIIDSHTEAMCSFVAGIMGVSKAGIERGGVLVIDQGGGSLELASGRASPIRMVDFVGLPLGGNSLLKGLRDHKRDINAFQASLLPELEKCRVPKGDVDTIVIQGTVATKCAWLMQRKDKSEKYDPKRVQGTRVQRDRLEVLLSVLLKFADDKHPEKRWAEFQEFVNPGETGGDAGERVASGIILILHFLHRLKKDEFFVSSLGTRHGMAWLLAQEPGFLESLLVRESPVENGSHASLQSPEPPQPLAPDDAKARSKLGSVKVVRKRSKTLKASPGRS